MRYFPMPRAVSSTGGFKVVVTWGLERDSWGEASLEQLGGRQVAVGENKLGGA